MKKYKFIILNISLSLGLGLLSALFTFKAMNIYQKINTPQYLPPSYVFLIVWTILYILMGLASYFLQRSHDENKETALIIYYFQLLINFSWPIVFFNYQSYLLALIIVIVLILLVLYLIKLAYQIRPLASFLLFPYLGWLLFVLYLNFWIFINN